MRISHGAQANDAEIASQKVLLGMPLYRPSGRVQPKDGAGLRGASNSNVL